MMNKKGKPCFIYNGFNVGGDYQLMLNTLLERYSRREHHKQIMVVNCTKTVVSVVVQDLQSEKFIVLSTYWHGAMDRCSFDGFSSGSYDLDLKTAVNEALRRVEAHV